ncbi:MAG: nitrate reductase molybdenum cofactor assembly chaperone [Candidatus Neomarinimicrobiota bacterium]
MVEEIAEQNVFRLFADLLEYPRPGLRESVRECEALIASKDAETGALLGKFRTFVKESSLEKMQEVYTTTFDLGATYHPYVGYHLLGESYKRSAFLLELKERFRAEGFTAEEKELPDHLAVLLRFMSVCHNEETTEELAREGLLPVLKKMLKENKQADRSDNDSVNHEFKSEEEKEKRQTGPYRNVLQALRFVLQQQYPMMEKEEEIHV